MIYSDSEYTIKVAQGVYQMKANPDLWSVYRELLSYRKRAPVFEWVRGHAGQEHNERADELAGIGAFNGNSDAYHAWQASNAAEAHNKLPPAELAALRQKAQKLLGFMNSNAEGTAHISPQERTFITDIAKRLQKNNFVPTEKQSNWLQGLAKKYRIQ
jgi:tyrosyl-tRNA synthetase